MRENVLANLGNDRSTDEQYFDTMRRSEHLEPEMVLLIALLDDAIQSYRKFSRARDREGKKQFSEAAEWIMARDDQWIFAFNNVCEMLGLDPEYVRRGLGEMSRKAPDEAGIHRRRLGHRRAA